MAIGYLEKSGHTAYGIADFVLDDDTDIADLPIDVPMGSTAYVIETGKLLMINSKGEWKEQ